MKTLIPIVVAALCVACGSKGAEDGADAPPETAAEKAIEKAPEKAAEKPPEKAAEKPPEKAAEKPPEKAAEKPPEQAAPVSLVVKGRSMGPIDDKTPFEQKALAALLPGYVVERRTFEAEGDTYVSFVLTRGGVNQVTLGEGHGGLSASILVPSIKDEKGIGLGSTHSALMAAWPDAKCELFVLEQPTDGVDPFKSVDCRLPQAQSIWYRIDVTDLKGVGKTLPAAEAIAERPITSFTADFPPLGGWK